MRLPTQSLAVRQNRSFYAPSIKLSSEVIRASLQLRGGVSSPDQGPIYVPDPGPQVAYASIDVKCGGTIYTVSTGNNRGECHGATTPDGIGAGGCTDGRGNSAVAGCGTGCEKSSGSGSCTVKA